MSDDGREHDPDSLAEALTTALSRRAAEVRSTPDVEARAAVDQRLRQRARSRNARRGTLAAVVLIATALAGSLIVARPDNAPEVATGGDNSSTTTVALQLGMQSDDPGALGLPRIVLDRQAGLEPVMGQQPAVTTVADLPEPLKFTQMQVFHPATARVPVVFAPWDPVGAERPLPVPGVDGIRVDINGRDATLQGQAPGLRTLSWLMADNTKAYLYGFGVTDDQLTELARGLNRPDPTKPGYEVSSNALPDGFDEETTQAPPPGDVRAISRIDYVPAASQQDPPISLLVGSGTKERSEERLLSLLTTASDAEPVEIMGKPGLLLTNADDSWTVLWSPAPGTGVELAGTDASRGEVETLLAALRTVGRAEWAQFVSDARANG